MALLVQLMQAITLGMIFLCVAAAGVGVNGDDVRDRIAAQLTARDQWAAMRRSPNVEDRSGEPPFYGSAPPTLSVPQTLPYTPLGIDAGARDVDQDYLRKVFLLKAQAAGAAMSDETMGELAAQDEYDPTAGIIIRPVAPERSGGGPLTEQERGFRANATNMSVQPPDR